MLKPKKHFEDELKFSPLTIKSAGGKNGGISLDHESHLCVESSTLDPSIGAQHYNADLSDSHHITNNRQLKWESKLCKAFSS